MGRRAGSEVGVEDLPQIGQLHLSHILRELSLAIF